MSPTDTDTPTNVTLNRINLSLCNSQFMPAEKSIQKNKTRPRITHITHAYIKTYYPPVGPGHSNISGIELTNQVV